MSLMRSLVGQDLADNTVSIPDTNFSTLGLSGPSYSGVKFGSDGNMYKHQVNGGWSNAGAWLLKGTASSYYLQRVINAGSLDNDAGDGVQLNADREYDIIQSVPFSAKTATVTFEISTDAPGTTVVAGPTAQVYLTSWETGA